MNEIVNVSPRDKFLQHFDNIDFSFDSKESLVVRELAKDQLSSLEFPTSKTEYWKYTRINPLIKGNYTIEACQKNIDIAAYSYPSAIELVFVNGFYRSDLSTVQQPKGLKVCSLSEAKEDHAQSIGDHFGKNTAELNEIFACLNGAYHNDGAFVLADKNSKIDQPIHILHLIDGDHQLAQPRNLIIAEEGSEIKIIESFQNFSGTGCFINSVSEFFIKENARLEFNKLQDLGPSNYHIATEQIHLERNSNFEISTFSLSGKLLRNNLNASLNNENAICTLNGLYLSKGKQHVDNHTLIDHKAPNCESHELYKGILNEHSTTVFNGRVLVRREAQRTNAFQSNANILLTDDVTANSKPELEIYADDVKCSHGSTTGQLDEEALFYLQARGIEEEKARNLLLYAFAGEVLDKLTLDVVKDKIDEYIAKRYHTEF